MSKQELYKINFAITNHLKSFQTSILIFTFSMYKLYISQLEIIPHSISEEDRFQFEKVYGPYKYHFDKTQQLSQNWVSTIYPKLSSDVLFQLNDICSTILIILDPIKKLPNESAHIQDIIRSLHLTIESNRSLLHEYIEIEGVLTRFQVEFVRSVNKVKEQNIQIEKEYEKQKSKVASLRNELTDLSKLDESYNEEIIKTLVAESAAALTATGTVGVGLSIALAPTTVGVSSVIGPIITGGIGLVTAGVTSAISLDKQTKKRLENRLKIIDKTYELNAQEAFLIFIKNIGSISEQIEVQLSDLTLNLKLLLRALLELKQLLNTRPEALTILRNPRFREEWEALSIATQNYRRQKLIEQKIIK